MDVPKQLIAELDKQISAIQAHLALIETMGTANLQFEEYLLAEQRRLVSQRDLFLKEHPELTRDSHPNSPPRPAQAPAASVLAEDPFRAVQPVNPAPRRQSPALTFKRYVSKPASPAALRYCKVNSQDSVYAKLPVLDLVRTQSDKQMHKKTVSMLSRAQVCKGEIIETRQDNVNPFTNNSSDNEGPPKRIRHVSNLFV